MKKIIISLSIIGLVGATVAGVTGAYYSDTETSNGNIFVAGAIDLQVDHTKASYNGEECKTCHLEIVSDETTKVGEATSSVLSFLHANWTADLDGGHVPGVNNGSNDGSKWIWVTNGPTHPSTDQEYTFDRSFAWNGAASAVTLYLATDNLYSSVRLNGNLIGSTADPDNFTAATEDVFVVPLGYLVQGTNLLQVTVRNLGGNPNPQENPAGLLFKLEIDGICDGQNGIFTYQNTPDKPTCMLWGPKDLDGSEYYFDFDDVKPGDYGTNLISLHVDSNDAYACLVPHDLNDQENLIVDPEDDAGDLPNLGNVNGYGELSNYLEFFLWKDTNGDGAYQNPELILVGPGATLHEIQTEMIALQLTGGGPISYVGLAWCAGTQGLSGSTITCNGAGMGDIAQTDSVTASLTAYAVQTRNNPNFSCEDVVLPGLPQPR